MLTDLSWNPLHTHVWCCCFDYKTCTTIFFYLFFHLWLYIFLRFFSDIILIKVLCGNLLGLITHFFTIRYIIITRIYSLIVRYRCIYSINLVFHIKKTLIIIYYLIEICWITYMFLKTIQNNSKHIS